MDNISIEEFLMQLGGDFAPYAEIFRKNGFDSIGSLRCINIEEDLKEMFEEANVKLLLGKKRQLQNALQNLKEVQPNATLVKTQKPSLSKIAESTKECAKTIKRQISIAEAEYATMILAEKEKDGRRCNNCHRTGHKADGNKNNKSCTNYPCGSISFCGQADKHPEYQIEKRKSKKK